MALSQDGLSAWLRLQRLFQQTLLALREYLEHDGDCPPEQAAFLATETLSHVEAAQEGLRQTARASEASEEEWRALLRPADLIACAESPDSRPRRLNPARVTEIEAVNHARVVLGLVPRVPAEAVSFPGFPSYRDIPVPRSPASLTARLEEIERAVWYAAAQRRHPELAEFRRVYAFFEAGSIFGDPRRLFRTRPL
ncbi:MAG: hypothetical protein K6U89_09785 [Chloroflexi bacterium]|nr:hypothetical protein [Chloroflexota bacterium]